MDDDKKLPVLATTTGLATVAGSSLLSRGIASLHRSTKDDAAENLFRQAMARCAEVDFVAMSEINGPWDDNYDWTKDAAFQLLSEAAALDHRDAKFRLGAMLAHDSPLDAINWYRKAADQSHPEAAFQYIKYLYLDPPEQRSDFALPVSKEKAFELLEVAARANHRRAANQLGYLLLEQSRNPEEAAPASLRVRAQMWFRKAAEAGDGDSAFEYAELLFSEDRKCADYVEAARWYSFGAEAGHFRAAVELAYLCERGLGVEKDLDRAARLYRQAGDNARDSGDVSTAIHYLRAAAALGDVDAAFLVGKLLMQRNDSGDEVDARFYWEKAGDAGHIEAAAALGAYFANTGEKEASRTWTRKAAELGHAESQYCLGRELSDRELFNDAITWFRKAAEQGHIGAAFSLGFRLRWGGKGVEIDEKEAARWMIFAADQEHSEACFYAGWMLNTGFGISQDYKRAAHYYKLAAKRNGPVAINNLGILYEYGRGVRKSPKKAFALYMRAARMGSSLSKHNLACCYKDGTGVEQDHAEALIWILAAAQDDNDPAAQDRLGRWYYDGAVVPQSDEIALRWFIKAAGQGHVGASVFAGWMFEYAKGIGESNQEIVYYTIDGVPARAPDNLSTACYYYRKAAESGSAVGQTSVAIMYENGRGVQKTLDEAIRWYRLAARQMNQRAIDALKRLGVDIHGPVIPARTIRNTHIVEERVRKALESVLSKAGGSLPHSK